MLSDLYERKKALDTTQSFIVQAPAGSGKTELLTQRYLKLLALCNSPENAVVLTFTNKAVGELKERITQSLQMSEPQEEHKKLSYDLAQKVLKRSDELGWDILNNNQRLTISTIDGLNAKIINNYPKNGDFSKKSVLKEEFESLEFYENSAKLTLLEIDNEESVKNLLTNLDGNCESFISLVARMLKFRDKWITKLFDKNQVNLDNLVSCIKNINQEYLAKIQTIASENLTQNFFNLCLTNAKLSHIQQIPQTLREWQELKKLLLTGDNAVRKSVAGFDKNNRAEFMAIVNNFPKKFLELIILSNTMPSEDINQELLTDVIKVLLIANLNLQNEFDKFNKTDFTEIMLGSIEAIDDNTETSGISDISDIALTLDYQIQHILLDEFQDTSYSQLNLLTKLTQNWELESGRTLFLVGDPMQAIYQFRGGEVGVFLEVQKNGLGNINLENLVLSENFRSTKSIVEANNNIFANIFLNASDENNIVNGDVVLSKSTTSNNDDYESVQVYPFAKNSENEQAEQILQVIKNNSDKEIAILCVAKSHMLKTIELCAQNNIDIEKVKTSNLGDNIWSLELLAIIKILLNPEDKLAWFAFLRSTKIGLTLDEILAISIDGDIWNNIKNSDGKIQQIIYQVFNDIFNNFGSFSTLASFVSVAKQLDFESSMNEVEKIIFDKFCEVVATLEKDNNLTADFIIQKLSKMHEPSTTSNVKIMTIHQSKGLEFDFVIIPHLEKPPKNQNKELIYLSEFENFGIMLATKADESNFKYLREQEKTKLFNERKRLLYVAMTRAKEQIHLLGGVEKDKPPVKNSLLGFLWNDFCKHFQDVEEVKNDFEYKLPTWGRYDLTKKETNKILRLEEHKELITTEFDSSIIGVVVHKFLQLEIFNPTQNQVKNQLLGGGISFETLEKYTKNILEMFEVIKSSVDFDFIFKDRESTQVEAEFIFKNKSFIIDRFFIEDNILWIIDFKTVFGDVKKHQKQMDNYKNILSSIYDYKIKTAIFWTDVGRIEILT
jgi:ATP-dependent helicase/nuclease subunit A